MSVFLDLISLLSTRKTFQRREVPAHISQKIKERWNNEVETALKGGKPSQLKQSLILADKLLDNALGAIVKGSKMSERLKNAKHLYEWEDYDRIWKAHKVRNALVHDLQYEPNHLVLKEAIHNLEKGLKEIGVKV